MAVVVVEDERADPEAGRSVGRGHERGDGSGLLAEVVRQVERRVPHRLERARPVAPLLGAVSSVLLDAESKRPGLRHLSMKILECALRRPTSTFRATGRTVARPVSMLVPMLVPRARFELATP